MNIEKKMFYMISYSIHNYQVYISKEIKFHIPSKNINTIDEYTSRIYFIYNKIF